MPDQKATVRFRKLHPEAIIPRYMTDGAAGMDLSTRFAFKIYPGERRAIPLGLSVEIPPGFEGQVRPRSGLAVKRGVTVLNSPGCVDSDFRGELNVILINHNEDPVVFEIGDRIAQLVIAPVVRAEIVEVDELFDTARGTGGLGSTGQ